MSIPVNEILQVCGDLAKKKELKVTLRSTVEYSVLGGIATGLGAALGGVLGGPPGLAIGGIAAATLSGGATAGKFKSVIAVIREDMTEEQRKQLADACWTIISKVSLPNIVADAASLWALLSSDTSLQEKIVEVMKNFFTTSLNMSLV